MTGCGVFLFGPGTERLQSSIEPGQHEQHLEAKLALSNLAFAHDRIYVEKRLSDDFWRVDCWDYEPCSACDGLGRDPERNPRHCRPCSGTGRNHKSEPTLSRAYLLGLDGELRPVEQEARAA